MQLVPASSKFHEEPARMDFVNFTRGGDSGEKSGVQKRAVLGRGQAYARTASKWL
jgi:hypothetical protein